MKGMKIGILGGTGPAGRGLAVRLASVGHEVILGSRDGDRAEQVASEVRERAAGRANGVTGGLNEQAASADLVVLATPWESALQTVQGLREPLAGKVVISMVNALVKNGREMLPMYPPRGSVAEMVQAALPDSIVAASFHHLPAGMMEDLDSGLEADVLVCSDHKSATQTTLDMLEGIAGLRALDAGSLAQAAAIEAFTAVAITLNIRYKTHSTLKMAGL
jgi:NADPH-dependent F420 reductase